MSCLSMPNKFTHLLPSSSKKAWKSFTSSVSPKLRYLHHHLKLPKSVSKIARRLLCINRAPKPRPFMGRASGMGRLYYRRYQRYTHIQQSGPNYASAATVYVDRLFGHGNFETSTSGAKVDTSNDVGHDHAGVKRRKEKARKCNNDADHNAGEVKWKEYVSSLPAIRGVDERAEEFISKFRYQMHLQREQSILDFHEMLARST